MQCALAEVLFDKPSPTIKLFLVLSGPLQSPTALMQGAAAIADVLFGKVSPSGRLPVTFYHANYTQLVPAASMDMAAWPGRTHRYLQEPALYPFGYGLSYTTFSYTNLRLDPADFGETAPASVQVDICNTGGAVRSSHDALTYHRPQQLFLPLGC